MSPLEGREVEKKFDSNAGEVFVDVNDKGAISFGVSYDKDLDGFAKVKAVISLESNIFTIAEKIAAKTATPFDDSAIAGIKSLLGIKD